MTENDITILNLDIRPRSRLYYYQGNFYYPLEGLTANIKNLIKLKINQFKKENKEMILKDRKDPEYKNILQIFDEQFIGNN
jgi:hypothetical protein